MQKKLKVQVAEQGVSLPQLLLGDCTQVRRSVLALGGVVCFSCSMLLKNALLFSGFVPEATSLSQLRAWSSTDSLVVSGIMDISSAVGVTI